MANNEKKEVRKPSQKPAQNTLQKRYMALSPRDQLGVTNFFNLHNAAHYVYDGLTEDAQSYVTYCISLSTKADNIEKKNSAQVL